MNLPEKMQALFPVSPDGPLQVREVPVPLPGAGEVLIRMLAAPVNPSDLARIRETPREWIDWMIPGIEGCGVVVKAGKGLLPHLWNGRRVACTSVFPHSGTWAEYMVTSAGSCFPLPSAIPDDQGSMLFVNPLTALAFLHIIRKGKHRAVISLAAASALGKMISSLCRKNGITVINIVRRPSQLKILKDAGADIVLDSSAAEFPGQFEQLLDKYSPDLLLDPVGGKMTPDLFELMPEGSVRIIYGRLSGEHLSINPHTLISDNKTVKGFYLGDWLHSKGILRTLRMLLQARKLLSGDVQIEIRERIPLYEINDALERYLTEMSGGKIILTPFR